MKHRVLCLVIASLISEASLPSAHASNIFVTTTTQKISASGGCSLQEAVYSANFDNNIAIDHPNLDGTDHFLTDASGQLAHTEYVPGNGDDTIVLPTGGVLQMYEPVQDSYNPAGPTATPIILTNVTIEGFGAQLVYCSDVFSTPLYARAFTVGRATITKIR
jgi:hypothetical protein